MSDFDDLRALPDAEFQRLFAAVLLSDPGAAVAFVGGVNPDFFSSPSTQYLVRFALEFGATYHVAPISEVVAAQVGLDLDRGKLSDDDAASVLAVYERLYKAQANPADQAWITWVREKAGVWLKQAALTEAIQQSAEDIAAGRQVDYVKRFQDAIQVGEQVEASRPHFGFTDAEAFLAAHKEEGGQLYGTGLPELDASIAGGLRVGGVGVFMAATGKGKSHALVFVGRNAVMAGHNVLHVTLEMDELSVWDRYQAGITGVDSAFVAQHTERVLSQLEERIDLYPGEFAIYEYPTRNATCNTLRALLNHVKTKGFQPAVLIVDYADLLLPSTGRKDAAQWESQGVVYEELRGLAREYGLVVWTAAQTNRDGHRSTNGADLDQIASSYAKAQVADIVVALSGDKDEDRGVVKAPRWFVPRKIRRGLTGPSVGVILDLALSSFSYDPTAKHAPKDDGAKGGEEEWSTYKQGGTGSVRKRDA